MNTVYTGSARHISPLKKSHDAEVDEDDVTHRVMKLPKEWRNVTEENNPLSLAS